MPRAISSSIEIDAPRDVVWRVLRDFGSYPEWNPFTVSVVTMLEVGSAVDMQVRLRPPRTMRQVEYVSKVVEGERMCWGANVGPSWFIRANRCQWLEDLGDGRTRYSTSDEFEGVGVGLMLRTVGPSVQRGFDDVARALKERAEDVAASKSALEERDGHVDEA